MIFYIYVFIFVYIYIIYIYMYHMTSVAMRNLLDNRKKMDLSVYIHFSKHFTSFLVPQYQTFNKVYNLFHSIQIWPHLTSFPFI